jgi:Cu2+-exporting ATPase
MMQVMMYAVPTYLAGEGEIGADAGALLRWAGLVLTLPVLMYSAGPMFSGAWRDLRERHLGMDVPVALGLAVAFAGSAWNTVAGAGEVYFDSVTMFVFLLLGARYLEMLARGRANMVLLPLARIMPRCAHRLKGDGLETEEVPAGNLAVGDRILVRPGETLPADGRLENPQATLDEAWMTGESRPVVHAGGDIVLGGCVNAGSALSMTVARVGAATSISSIQRLMERALGERPRWAAAAQRAVPPFIAGVLLAAIGAWLAWLAIDAARAPWIAVSVLIVTCPCALALAAPAVVTLSAGTLARRGVVVAHLDAIETLAGVTDVVFDKTGTLTSAHPVLAETFAFGQRDPSRMLSLAAAIARGSSHPLDAAVVEAAIGLEVLSAGRHESHSGQGVEAMVDARRMRLGSAQFAGALAGHAVPMAFIGGGDPVAWLADESGWLAAFRFTERARVGARDAVARLGRQGVKVHLLSGDTPDVVRCLARELGVERWEAAATPATKRTYVSALQSAGSRVAMVGDGINDAPVLAQADVALAMGSGADIARMRADMVLLDDSPGDVAAAVDIARKTRRIVRQNLSWALAYNAIAIPLAVMGLVTPLAAGIGMSASSVIVIANAFRVRR